jgi:hypothetical protein
MPFKILITLLEELSQSELSLVLQAEFNSSNICGNVKVTNPASVKVATGSP